MARHRPARNAAAVPATAQAKPVDKFPELRKAMDDLRAEKDKLLAKSQPHRDKREKLLAKIQPLEAELREVNQAITDAHGERLFELDNQIAALARGMGARVLSQGTTET